jgi:polyhydroxyalkanoate synthesis regulator phasin
MHIGGISHEIQELRNLISNKSDKYETQRLESVISRLEQSVDALNREKDDLASRVDGLDYRVRQMEAISHEPVTFVSDENGFLKVAGENK